MGLAELEDPEVAHQLLRDPCCHCDRCESMRACESATLPMVQCEECGGRATLPPTCIACTIEVLDRLIALASKSVAAGGRSNLFGSDLLALLKLRRRQLPADAERVAFWRHCRPRPIRRV
jgi:hypothetical protein